MFDNRVHVPFLVKVLGVALAFVLSGCSITQLQHTELVEPEHRQSGVVEVEKAATGFTGGRVGWGRFSLFAIPVAPIHIHGDEAVDLMTVVSNALATAGYTPALTAKPQNSPVLKAHVNEVRFNNYTWFAPLVPTWGRINVTLSLISPVGALLWEQSFEGKGKSFDFTDGYNKAAIKGVTQLANSMVEAFAAEEFREALQRYADEIAAAVSTDR